MIWTNFLTVSCLVEFVAISGSFVSLQRCWKSRCGLLQRGLSQDQNYMYCTITADHKFIQDVTCRSKSIIENAVDKSIVLDIC